MDVFTSPVVNSSKAPQSTARDTAKDTAKRKLAKVSKKSRSKMAAVLFCLFKTDRKNAKLRRALFTLNGVNCSITGTNRTESSQVYLIGISF